MREMIIQFQGEEWDDEDEAETMEEEVVNALDAASVDYVDVYIK